MKIVMMGSGAIGSLFGGLLAEQGNDVTLIGRRQHIDKINRSGLTIEDGEETHQIRVAATVNPRMVENPDLIILTVKAYDTEQAVKDIQSIFKQDTYLMCLQNGLGTEEIAESILKRDNIIRGTTSEGALFLEPGKVRHTGTGETIIGYAKKKPDSLLNEIKGILEQTGFKTTVSDNIKKVVWEKIFVNAAINPFGALTGLRNGDLLTIPQLKDAMSVTILEGIKVAEKLGININRQNSIEKAFNVAKMTAKNKNSMLQDIEKRKKTEIDYINGALVKYGEKSGVSCPINSILTALVKGLEKKNELLGP